MVALNEKRTVVGIPVRTHVCDPLKFFQNCSKLSVWYGFKRNVLVAAPLVDSSFIQEVEYSELLDKTSDTQIRGELSQNHVFKNASVFCVMLAGMLMAQLSGTQGTLLTNGCGNIFYVRGRWGELFAVYVRWCDVNRKWSIGACILEDAYPWDAGVRVFSRH